METLWDQPRYPVRVTSLDALRANDLSALASDKVWFLSKENGYQGENSSVECTVPEDAYASIQAVAFPKLRRLLAAPDENLDQTICSISGFEDAVAGIAAFPFTHQANVTFGRTGHGSLVIGMPVPGVNLADVTTEVAPATVTAVQDEQNPFELDLTTKPSTRLPDKITVTISGSAQMTTGTITVSWVAQETLSLAVISFLPVPSSGSGGSPIPDFILGAFVFALMVFGFVIRSRHSRTPAPAGGSSRRGRDGTARGHRRDADPPLQPRLGTSLPSTNGDILPRRSSSRRPPPAVASPATEPRPSGPRSSGPRTSPPRSFAPGTATTAVAATAPAPTSRPADRSDLAGPHRPGGTAPTGLVPESFSSNVRPDAESSITEPERPDGIGPPRDDVAPAPLAPGAPTASLEVVGMPEPIRPARNALWFRAHPSCRVEVHDGSAEVIDSADANVASHPVASGARSWTVTQPRWMAAAVYTEKNEAMGEDADPTLIVSTQYRRALLAVYDGLGGAGAAGAVTTPAGVSFNDAFLASRLVRQAFESWYLRCVLEGEAHDPVTFAAQIEGRLREINERYVVRPPTAVTSSLTKVFPTTLAAVSLSFSKSKKKYALQTMWAGDSRAYILRPNAGLQLLTIDHVRAPEPLEQLITGSPMRNVVNAGEFFISDWVYYSTEPFIVLCATDGVFEYVQTPGQTEHVLLETMQRSASIAEWSDSLAIRLTEYTGDDATLSLACIGWADFDSLRRNFAALSEQIAQSQSAPFEGLDKNDRTLFVARRAEAWEKYRVSHEGLLKELRTEVTRL